MNISAMDPLVAAIATTATQNSAQSVQSQASVSMLKKSLDSQQQTAEKLIDSGLPKGQLIDIRA